MVRKVRSCEKGIAHHIIVRGVNRQDCFLDKKDKLFYLTLIHQLLQKYSNEIHAWVLMTNHAHFIVTPSIELGLSKMMQEVSSRYTRYFNRRYRRSGGLWEGRFKSFLISDERYILELYRYIELNPVRASIVEKPEQYVWSSYRTNAFGKPSKIVSPHPAYTSIGNDRLTRCSNYRQLFN